MASTRRLAAILAADVAGYSRLMGADEEGTHERLRRHLRDLIDPKIKEHRGLSLCRWWVTASARRVGGRLGSRVLRWLGRGKRSVGGIAGVSGS